MSESLNIQVLNILHIEHIAREGVNLPVFKF
jgi:hypothetical protein